MGRTVYQERASTPETVNADVKMFRGLHAFAVRGLKQVRGVALWSAPAHHLPNFSGVRMT